VEIIVLTRRAFTGGIGCSVLGLVELAGTGAAAQERSPAVARVSGKGPKIDPRIRRLLRSRTPLDLDIARGLVKAGPATSSGASQFTIPTLALFRSDAIPGNLRHHKWDRIAGQIYAADLLRDDFQQLESDPDVLYVEGGQAVRPTIDTSRTEIRAKEVQAPQGGGSGQASGLTGEGVIVGIIDGGLDFTLDDFRDEKGNTRILFLWDQDLTRQGTEQPPAGFDFGVEYTASHIRDELARHPIAPWSVVRHKPKKADHGTHVAGIAVGNGRSHDEMFPIGQYVGIAPRADIIFVSGASTKNDNTADLARAVKYIFQKADELGKPCVINISLGSGGGSHDGQSLVERAFDDMLLQKPGRAIVKAAGNQHGTSTHFSDVLKAGVQQLIWRVHANDRSENEIEIWFSSQDRVRTRLKGPGGIATPWVAPDNHIEGDWGAVHINIMSDSATALNGDALIFIEVKPLGGDIPAGDWFIELEVQNPKAGRFHVWIERDDAKAENQSYFVKPNGERVSGGKTTLSFPGTGIRTIAVANYQHLKVPVEVAGSSGRGPTRDGRRKPEVAAPGTAIVASCALGGRPDGHGGKYPMRVAKSGTSMAAPHVAGAIALILQRHPTLTAWDIRTALIKSARRMPQEDDFTPSWGHGRLDIVACLEALEP
jgi:subtilisin family serine protease